jgi:uracil phosphoribosyltransferase
MYHLPGSAPVQYFNRLPKKCESDIAYVVDPVIASAETMMAVIAILKKVCNDDDAHVLFVYCYCFFLPLTHCFTIYITI